MDDVHLSLNHDRLKFMHKVFDAAFGYEKLDNVERKRLLLWDDYLTYMEEYHEVCVKDR